MRTYFDCIPCFVRQALDSARLITQDEDMHERVLCEVLKMVSGMELYQSPPAMGQQIHRTIRRLTGISDPYLQVKNRFNKLALQMYPELKEKLDASADGLGTAIRLALAGNVIDFGVSANLLESEVQSAIDESFAVPLDAQVLEAFRDRITSAKDILYLADNAGEIVFDQLLIEQLPRVKVTLVVKGAPVINDATIEDAQIAGLTDIVNVIDNGSDAPGTILESCSEDFRNRFDRADLVIAKGQGNYETINDIDKDTFFILRAKCPVIARHLGCDINSPVFVGCGIGICNKRN